MKQVTPEQTATDRAAGPTRARVPWWGPCIREVLPSSWVKAAQSPAPGAVRTGPEAYGPAALPAASRRAGRTRELAGTRRGERSPEHVHTALHQWFHTRLASRYAAGLWHAAWAAAP